MCVQGIHDIHPNGTIPGQSGSPAVYAAQLANITVQLQQMEPQAKLLFAVTSPMLNDKTIDDVVVQHNKHTACIAPKSERRPVRSTVGAG